MTSATERGKAAAKKVYAANRSLAYYGACAADHNWVGVAKKWLGRSQTGEKGCDTEAVNETGKYKDSFINSCYAELDRICVGS